jgi:hypothetical protein
MVALIKVLSRLKMNSGLLPEDLLARWPMILEIAPTVLYKRWGPAVGANMVAEVTQLLQEIPRDRRAFEGWLRRFLTWHRGDVKL